MRNFRNAGSNPVAGTMELNERFIQSLESGREIDRHKRIWFFRSKVSVRIQTVIDNRQDKVLLSRICCYDRGNGYASQALRIITRLADKTKVSIRLYPKPFWLTYRNDGGLLSIEQLVKWYKKNGFVWRYRNSEKDWMVRKPK